VTFTGYSTLAISIGQNVVMTMFASLIVAGAEPGVNEAIVTARFGVWPSPAQKPAGN
jgi:uncharacterized membrane protein YcjF (UPF0283 family)